MTADQIPRLVRNMTHKWGNNHMSLGFFVRTVNDCNDSSLITTFMDFHWSPIMLENSQWPDISSFSWRLCCSQIVVSKPFDNDGCWCYQDRVVLHCNQRGITRHQNLRVILPLCPAVTSGQTIIGVQLSPFIFISLYVCVWVCARRSKADWCRSNKSTELHCENWLCLESESEGYK